MKDPHDTALGMFAEEIGQPLCLLAAAASEFSRRGGFANRERAITALLKPIEAASCTVASILQQWHAMGYELREVIGEDNPSLLELAKASVDVYKPYAKPDETPDKEAVNRWVEMLSAYPLD